MFTQWNVKGHNPQKAYLHPLRDMYVPYENNPANSFHDIPPETKHGRMARHAADNILLPTSWAGDKKGLKVNCKKSRSPVIECFSLMCNQPFEEQTSTGLTSPQG